MPGHCGRRAGPGRLEARGDAGAWLLTGPGIRGQATLPPCGLAHDFVPQWQANHAAFPCGGDLLVGGAADRVGLPRTTRIVRTPHDPTEEGWACTLPSRGEKPPSAAVTGGW